MIEILDTWVEVFLVNSQAERLISVLKESLTSLQHYGKAPYIQPALGCHPLSPRCVTAICSSPAFLWRCQLLFSHQEGRVLLGSWAEHDGARLCLAARLWGSWVVLNLERCLAGLPGQGCPGGRLCLLEEHIPSCQLCFNFLHNTKSSLSSMLFEKQCNFVSWRLDSRDPKTSGLAVPE